jgi:hypothetical protein
MADMDTYNDEQRGYEGNYQITQGGYNGHSERHPRTIQYHYDLYYSLTWPSLLLTTEFLQTTATTDVSALARPAQTATARLGSAMSP